MRLIDADVLIEEMKKTETEYENAMTYPSWWSAFNVISEQPTAYDIDKVVDELERFPLGNLGCQELNEIIEIVKQGSVADDVCEWKDKELYGYYTSCTEFRSRIACKDTYWKYCPYCGKKIKIVGD